MPCLNPARALGPSFVWDRWEWHWVQWLGPLGGGLLAGLIHEFIFNPRRQEGRRGRRCDDSLDGGDSSSIQSDEDAYDPEQEGKYGRAGGGGVNGSPSSGGGGPTGVSAASGAASLYSAAPPARLERVESLYGGTRSLYCKSPPLTRANLHRSQSVYAKSAGGGGPATMRERELVPRPGPLVPAVSLYPMRLQQHVQNQNAQNQARSVGGVGGPPPQRPICQQPAPLPPQRPESVYGRARSAHSDDSSYGSTYRAKVGPNVPPSYAPRHSPSYHHSSNSQY